MYSAPKDYEKREIERFFSGNCISLVYCIREREELLCKTGVIFLTQKWKWVRYVDLIFYIAYLARHIKHIACNNGSLFYSLIDYYKTDDL